MRVLGELACGLVLSVLLSWIGVILLRAAVSGRWSRGHAAAAVAASASGDMFLAGACGRLWPLGVLASLVIFAGIWAAYPSGRHHRGLLR